MRALVVTHQCVHRSLRIIQVIYLNGGLKELRIRKVREGDVFLYFKTFQEDGTLYKSFTSQNGKVEGEVKIFYASGKLNTVTVHHEGDLLFDTRYDEQGNVTFFEAYDENGYLRNDTTLKH